MSQHFRQYPSADDNVIPWNATYPFPSLANKALKITPRIAPKNGSVFQPGNTIRLEFPAQGYVDPRHTTISFDLELNGYGLVATSSNLWKVWLQNNITSIIKRIKLSYGSITLEEIIDAGYLFRQIQELTTSAALPDQNSITSGVGYAEDLFNGGPINVRLVNQGITKLTATTANAYPNTIGTTATNTVTTRRYQITVPLGMFVQEKLIPTMWMASQLNVEIVLAPAVECIMTNTAYDNNAVYAAPAGTPSYQLKNVVLLPEVLMFDASYDKLFLEGLQQQGIPIQFSSWNTYYLPITGSTMQMSIPEKSRFLKSIFVFIRKQVATYRNDYGASLSSIDDAILESFQFRIGARYFPASPCLNTTVAGALTGNTEPFVELQKALYIMGDQRLSIPTHSKTWGKQALTSFTLANNNGNADVFGMDDGHLIASTVDANGKIVPASGVTAITSATGKTYVGSAVFCMAVNLETSSGKEFAGLNAEEQSDLSFVVKWSTPPPAGYELVAYTLSDQTMLLKENNVVELFK
jgi:hypothetical protein